MSIMSDKKKSFIVYHDIQAILNEMGNADTGKLFKAMVDYSSDGVEAQLSKSLKYIFIPIKQQLDRNVDSWIKTSKIRSEMGRKGGLAKASNSKQLPDLLSKPTVKAKVRATVNDTVSLAKIPMNERFNRYLEKLIRARSKKKFIPNPEAYKKSLEKKPEVIAEFDDIHDLLTRKAQAERDSQQFEDTNLSTQAVNTLISLEGKLVKYNQEKVEIVMEILRGKDV